MRLLTLLLVLLPLAGQADPLTTVAKSQILPGFATLAQTADALEQTASQSCDAVPLKEGYHALFDAWLGVSQFSFGPTQQDDRAFAVAFWPDTKGFTPKSIGRLIADKDPVVNDPEAFAHVSIAARGLFALEFLLFDARFTEGSPYHCALIRAVTADLARTATAMNDGWQNGAAAALSAPGTEGTPYQSREDSLRALVKALATSLQFTSDSRMGRPLGTLEHPRPRRAEARRSERSLRNIALSLEASRALALALAEEHPSTRKALEDQYSRALNAIAALDDPVLASVTSTNGRFRVAAAQSEINRIRSLVSTELAPALGVAIGFNALDGD